MKHAAIAFAGAVGAGKSSVSTRVAETLAWARVSFGDFVRAEARRRGLDAESRTVLQALGEQLIESGWDGFCHSVLTQGNWLPGRPIVIDGIRHVRAVETLRELVAPLPFYLILLEASEPVRVARIRDRGFQADDQGTQKLRETQHSTEAEVTSLLPAVADHRVRADGNINDTVKDVLDWLHVETA